MADFALLCFVVLIDFEVLNVFTHRLMIDLVTAEDGPS